MTTQHRNCKQLREGDEWRCPVTSCGLRWGADEDKPPCPLAWDSAEKIKELQETAKLDSVLLLNARGTGYNAMSKEQLDGLRELRLWHWQQVISFRHSARKAWNEIQETALDAKADFHIKQVQRLNDFFPDAGDTAERDDNAASRT